MSDSAAVETAGLSKRFGAQLAVDSVDLDVPTGSVYGFLGPNGSGKTTTIRLLLGLVTPTAGTVRLLGQPMPAAAAVVLPRVGALVEGPGLYPYLTGAQNLTRFAIAAGVGRRQRRARVVAALERVGLIAAAGKRVRAYSLGMRQRLGLAAALLRPPELLVLDEPTNGLDPQGTREVRALVRELAGQGVTVLVSSHLLAEIEQVCTHVGMMSAGKLLRQGPLEQVARQVRPRLLVTTPDPAGAATVLARHGLHDIRQDRDSVNAALDGQPVPALVAALVEAHVPVEAIARAGGALEDAFVAVTGEGFEVAG